MKVEKLIELLQKEKPDLDIYIPTLTGYIMVEDMHGAIMYNSNEGDKGKECYCIGIMQEVQDENYERNLLKE